MLGLSFSVCLCVITIKKQILYMAATCVVFDDSPDVIAKTCTYIEKYTPQWEIVAVASNPDACRDIVHTLDPNIIITDVRIGGKPIFDILRDFKEHRYTFIFMSSENSYASEVFQWHACAYLLKPVSEQDFEAAISRCLGKIMDNVYYSSVMSGLSDDMHESGNGKKKIAFNTNNGYLVRELNDIIYAKANSNYTEFYFNGNEKIMSTKTLLEYEKMLGLFGFVRIHQSYLVNFKYVVRFNTEHLQLCLSNDIVLPVSNRKKPVVMDILRGIF